MTDPRRPAALLSRDIRVWVALARMLDTDEFTRVKPAALAREAGISHASDACRVLRRLHRAGLLERRVVPWGKRAVPLYRIRRYESDSTSATTQAA